MLLLLLHIEEDISFEYHLNIVPTMKHPHLNCSLRSPQKAVEIPESHVTAAQNLDFCSLVIRISIRPASNI